MDTRDFDSANLLPTVDDGCETSVYEEAIGLDNAHPLNVSSNTPIATAANRADATGENSVENARAHRALLRGDDLYVGYTYTEDDALAQSTRPRANYNFWMRHFDAVAGTWASPKNLSRIRNLNVDAKEPRLMGTPGKGRTAPPTPRIARTPASSSRPGGRSERTRSRARRRTWTSSLPAPPTRARTSSRRYA